MTESSDGQIDIKVDDNSAEVSWFWSEDNPAEEGDRVTLFCTDSDGEQTSIVLEQDELLNVVTAGMKFLRAQLPKN